MQLFMYSPFSVLATDGFIQALLDILMATYRDQGNLLI
jgi:hypothetical protein